MSASTSFDVSQDGNWVCFNNLDFYAKSQIASIKITTRKWGDGMKYYVMFCFKGENISDKFVMCDDEETARQIVQRVTTPFVKK